MPFKPRKIIDPRTGQERIMSIKEQQALLAKGILIDIPFLPDDSQNASPEAENSEKK